MHFTHVSRANSHVYHRPLSLCFPFLLQLIGIAIEQCPSYNEVRALGGEGFNGGVQLLHLAAMRRSRAYAALLER